ncbi:glutaredoxin [Ganoderma leucocontextum]|nr:glutaredoxin [Ganoderma leucocontextum]
MAAAAAAVTNFYEVSSPEHFQNVLSEDLNRVSLINFWAPWAEPCKQMNEVVIELAKKYPQVVVLQVEAEEQGDIAESFDIEAVPAFVILRGHTLLSRISGADAPALTQELAKHTQPPSSIKPQSTTDRAPAAPAEEETAEQLNARLRKLMSQTDVVLFMKGSPDTPRCGFSRRIVGLLRNENVAFNHFDILQDEGVRQGLKVLNDWPTFPQLIVKGEFVGGLDVVQEMVDNGELKTLLA